MANCKACFRCGEMNPVDDMTTDAFGDHSIQMCDRCLDSLHKECEHYLLVKVPDIYGTTFIHEKELDDLKRYVGEENVEIIPSEKE